MVQGSSVGALNRSRLCYGPLSPNGWFEAWKICAKVTAPASRSVRRFLGEDAVARMSAATCGIAPGCRQRPRVRATASSSGLRVLRVPPHMRCPAEDGGARSDAWLAALFVQAAFRQPCALCTDVVIEPRTGRTAVHMTKA